MYQARFPGAGHPSARLPPGAAENLRQEILRIRELQATDRAVARQQTRRLRELQSRAAREEEAQDQEQRQVAPRRQGLSAKCLIYLLGVVSNLHMIMGIAWMSYLWFQGIPCGLFLVYLGALCWSWTPDPFKDPTADMIKNYIRRVSWFLNKTL